MSKDAKMKKILIVDDDAAIRKTVVKIVEGMGYITIESLDGKHAAETLQCNSDISLIITDMIMPRMDGRLLIREILREKPRATIPIIIMSGAVTVKDISDLLEIGAKAFLPKPLKAKDVKEYIARYLEEE
jgi:CheY-like chemotaxis protein